MTENKRFSVVMNEFDEVEYITDIVDCEDRDFADFIDFTNEMAKENEELKKRNEWLITQISNLTMNMYKLGIKIELEDEDGNSFDFMEMVLND